MRVESASALYARLRLEEMEADPGHRLHGTQAGYHYGCRCIRCCTAWRAANPVVTGQMREAAAVRLACGIVRAVNANHERACAEHESRIVEVERCRATR